MYTHSAPNFGIWIPVIVVVALAILVFEIWMIVDAATNKKLTDQARALWIIGMVLIHPIVAIVYFFTDRNKG